MSEQLGGRAFHRGVQQEAPYWARILPQLPRLVHQALAQAKAPDLAPLLADLARTQRQQRRLLSLIAVLLAALLLSQYL
jgi:ubiquinone biosynthesis protein